MSQNENFLNISDTQSKPKEFVNILEEIFGKETHLLANNGSEMIKLAVGDTGYAFEFFNVNSVTCSFHVFNSTSTKIYEEFEVARTEVYDRVKSIAENGIIYHGEYIFIVARNELPSYSSNKNDLFAVSPIEAEQFMKQMENDTLDEEEETSGDNKFSKELAKSVESIVPDIEQIRVVSLKLDGEVVAFRFKTNVGAFDMRKSVAFKYGLGGFKTEKFINLQSKNGLLLSKSEIENHAIVPDVSECEEDCKKLINALFQG